MAPFSWESVLLRSCESSCLCHFPTGLGRHAGVFMWIFQKGACILFSIHFKSVTGKNVNVNLFFTLKWTGREVARLRGFHHHFAVCTSFSTIAGSKEEMRRDLGMDTLIRNAVTNLWKRDCGLSTHSSTLHRYTWYADKASVWGRPDVLRVRVW